MQIEIVCATRKSEKEFWQDAALGLSLKRLVQDESWAHRVAYNNERSLSLVYNDAIRESRNETVLVFMHDDVWIDDYFFSHRLAEGLKRFDVIGLAGNRRRISRQPAWAFVNREFKWDRKQFLAGCVAHGPQPFGTVEIWSQEPAACELLDGVLLAAKKSTLVKAGCQFDPQFKFHFYDMDFCRTARNAGLKLGTWPIAVTHQSRGAFGSPSWQESYQLYLDKWTE